jgi:hypothetical protein
MTRLTGVVAAAWIIVFLQSGCDPAYTKLRIRNDSEISLCLVVKSTKGKIFLEGPGIRSHTTDAPALLLRPWESLLDREGQVTIELYDAADWNEKEWRLREGARLLRQVTVTKQDLDQLEWFLRYP